MEIGCGTARNLIAIARRYPEARLYGLDASAEMLETAQATIGEAGLEDRVVLLQGWPKTFAPEAFGAAEFRPVLVLLQPFDDPWLARGYFCSSKALSPKALFILWILATSKRHAGQGVCGAG